MPKILNFGSLNIDLVYSLDHIVTPGETTSSYEVNTFCGGKGLNQSVAAARSGSDVFHAGKIGADGDMLSQVLKDNNIDCTFLSKSNNKNGHALIQVDKDGQNSIILYHGTNYEITKEEIDSCLEHFKEGDILISQNEINNIDYLLSSAYKKGLRIALNPSPIDDRILNIDLNMIEWLIVNEIEGAAFAGDDTAPQKMIANLLLKNKELKIVMTIGKNGVIYGDKNGMLSHPAFKVDVVDTTGAGDTFLGYFISLMSKEVPIKAALKRASAAAALAITKNGAIPSIPTSDEVDNFLNLK